MKIRRQTFLEFSLVFIILSLGFLMYRMDSYKMVILNLFFMPVVLSGFFLGSYRAGVMALLSVIAALVASSFNLSGFDIQTTDIIIGLVLAVWGGVLGLVAILIGTLSDQRSTKILELHEAYVGVIEVLSRYLQSGNSKLTTRSIRVTELCQKTASLLKLSPRQIDDIRVAALLFDLNHVEVTTKVLKRAMAVLGVDPTRNGQNTFRGTELVDSLSTILTGAMPLLADQDETKCDYHETEDSRQLSEMPIGTKIIRIVRVFYDLTEGAPEERRKKPQQALQQMRSDEFAGYDEDILAALERAVVSKASLPIQHDLEEYLTLQS